MPMPLNKPSLRRRRIYLMRHGAVDYFRTDGTPIAPRGVALNAAGREQADAAGHLFAQAGVRFDRVLSSGLPRTVETAERVLAAAGLSLPVQTDARFEEIRSGRLDAIERSQLALAFTGVFSAGEDALSHRFLGGESIAELLERVMPAFDALLHDDTWREMLLVLHGGVNRALLSRVLAGRQAFFGPIEQSAGCISIIDLGTTDMVLRGINLAPTAWLQDGDRLTTMEQLLAQYQRGAAQAS